MKTLCQLVLQYKLDVETRIQCLKDEQDNCEAAQYDPEIYDDYQRQIEHWKVTLAEINEIIENNHLAFEFDNLEIEE